MSFNWENAGHSVWDAFVTEFDCIEEEEKKFPADFKFQ